MVLYTYSYAFLGLDSFIIMSSTIFLGALKPQGWPTLEH